MIGNRPAYNSAMDALRRQYAERLREREQAINALLEAGLNQALDANKRAELHNHAHSLVGSGATYGYPDISKAARALEEALDNGAGERVYVPLGKKLIDTCRSVSSTQAPPNNLQRARVLPKDKILTGKNVLIIDDDLSVHDFVKQLLKDEALIHSAQNGEEGLKLAQSGKPDLILLDGTMPGMQGMAVLETLQRNESLRDIPVIMLTAHNKNVYVTKAIEAGVVNYIVKPFDPTVLASRIRNILAGNSAKK